MTTPHHHIPDAQMLAYAAGQIDTAAAVALAAHISLCDECRSRLEAHQAVGGILLDDMPETALGDRAEAAMLALLDTAPTLPPVRSMGIYPAPLASYLNHKPPRWRALGGGVRQSILLEKDGSSLRLLSIPGGQAVPEHGHGGQEYTLVLHGGFSDETGAYGVGDLEVADADLDHTPKAWPGADCICLAATSAPLRFRALLPRLLQPIFRI